MAPPRNFQKVVFRWMPDNLENYRARIGTFCRVRNTKCNNNSTFAAVVFSLGFHFIIIPLLLLTASTTVVAINRLKNEQLADFTKLILLLSAYFVYLKLKILLSMDVHKNPGPCLNLRKTLFCYLECKLPEKITKYPK